MTTRLLGMDMCRILAVAALLGAAGPPARLCADERDEELAKLRQELQQTREKLESARDRVEVLEEQVAALGGKPDEAGDVADPLAGEEGELQPWSYNMRRSPMHVLFPGTATIPKHDVYGRFLHVSRESVNNKTGSGEQTEPFHSLLALEDNVRIGILFGYGITDRWDAWIQRTNGRTMLKDWSGDSTSFDYWDVMTKFRLLAEEEHGVDLAVYGGITYMMEDDESGDTSANAGMTVERSFFKDRLRLSTGLLYASLSAYERTMVSDQSDDVAMTKHMPGEVSTPFLAEGDDYTLAVPFGVSLALSRGWQAFAEGICPVAGYDTGKGPTLALGTRYVTNTHEFALYFANSGNNSFNSVLSGGYRYDRVDQFGFSISIFY
jgi:hypothetical protein